jgi:hypothetical protein
MLLAEVWWEGKLRSVAVALARRKHRGRYRDALCELANRIAVLELVPYHSTGFSSRSLLKKLASARHAKDHASWIQDKPLSKRPLIVVTRSVAAWGLVPGSSAVVYSRGLSKGASLGPNSPEGRAILARRT